MDGSKACLIALLGFGTAAFGIVGCRGTPQPVVRTEPPAQSPSKAAPAASPSQAPQPAADPGAPAAPADKPKQRSVSAVVVDQEAEGEGTPATLIEASRAEKERRAQAGHSATVINDKTLPRYARKGQITIMDPQKPGFKKGKKGAAAAAPAATAVADEVRDEQYWRSRGRDIRDRWRQAADDAKELEQKSAELRQKFYLENDLFVRDNRIKPEWDRILDRLRQARLDADASRQELSEFLDQGRAAGIMPGWLREGEEDEPKDPDTARKKKDALPPAQSIEPPVLNDKGPNTDGHGDDHGGRG
jgi:hypothetical protein